MPCYSGQISEKLRWCSFLIIQPTRSSSATVEASSPHPHSAFTFVAVMARFLSGNLTLTLALTRSSSNPLPICISSRFLAHRCRSTKAHLIEIDLDSTSSGGAASPGDVEVSTLKRLEDIVHSIIVRRSAPDWIPFLPGTSYWVPPRPTRAHQIVEIVGKISKPLSDEEKLSLTGVHGWPCSSFFLDGVVPHNPAAVEVEVKVHAAPSLEEESKEKASQSED